MWTKEKLKNYQEILVSKRKLNPEIRLNLASKAPRFVVKGKHLVVLEKEIIL